MGCPVELLAHNEDDPDGSPLQLDAEHVENNRGRLIVTLSALPTGAATSAKQDTSKGILDNIEAGIDELKVLVGEVQASPTENTVLERLKSITTALEAIQAVQESTGSASGTADVTATSAGDNECVAAPGASKQLWITKVYLVAARDSEVSMTLRSGTTAKTGAMPVDILTWDLDFNPIKCATNEAFNLYLSDDISVTGMVAYRVVDV